MARLPGTPRATPALVAAAGISTALDILRCSSLDDAADQLHPLLARGRSGRQSADTGDLMTHNRNPMLNAVTVRALSKGMSPTDQLRYRAHTPLPRSPQKLPAAMFHSIPTCLWNDWAIRMLPTSRATYGDRESARAALSMLLITVGNRTSEADIAQRLGLGRFGQKWARNEAIRIAALLKRHALWANVAVALTRLLDYLAEQPPPIDYARRRRLDYRKMLSDNEWAPIFGATDFGCLDRAHTGQQIRTWLFERVSTLPAALAPGTGKLDRKREAVELLAPPISGRLDQIALQFLKQRRVIDEPLTWSPPLSLVADLELPGLDVDSLSIQDVHPLILQRSLSIGEAATRLAVEPLVVRHLLERTPLPRPVCRGQKRPAPQTQLERAREGLSTEELVRLHHHEKWTIAAIAHHVGVGKTVLKQLAVERGVEVVPAPALRRKADSARLVHEHIDKGRTLKDIAHETGVNRKLLSSMLKEQGVPVRPGPTTRRQAPSITKEWIRREHIAKGCTLTDMALEAGMSRKRLSRIFAELGVPVLQHRRKPPKISMTADWITREHVVKGRSLTDMAREAGVPRKALARCAREL